LVDDRSVGEELLGVAAEADVVKGLGRQVGKRKLENGFRFGFSGLPAFKKRPG
jgi:hypothetical protein